MQSCSNFFESNLHSILDWTLLSHSCIQKLLFFSHCQVCIKIWILAIFLSLVTMSIWHRRQHTGQKTEIIHGWDILVFSCPFWKRDFTEVKYLELELIWSWQCSEAFHLFLPFISLLFLSSEYSNKLLNDINVHTAIR